MKLFSFLLNHSRGLLVTSILVGLIAGLASAWLLATVSALVDGGGAGIATGVGLAFAGIAFLAVGAELASRLILVWISADAVREMRIDLCRQIAAAPLRQVEECGSSKLMAALTEDVQKIAEAVAAFPTQCVNIAIVVACFVYLVHLSWPLSLGYAAIYVLGVIGYQISVRLAAPHMRQGREMWDRLIALYNGYIAGNKELKLHRQRRMAMREELLLPTADSMRRHAWKWNWILAIGTAHTQLVFFALIGLTLFIAPVFIEVPSEVVIGFVLMALYVSSPIAAIVGSLPKFQVASNSLSKIESLGLSLSLAGADVRAGGEVALVADPAGTIELQDVEFSYPAPEEESRCFSVGPFDLTVRPGEILFVIGGNGSGKSTFVRLLTGLYVPTSGRIMASGIVIDDANRDEYRQRFSAVFSDFHLFGSLLGLSGIEDFEAKAAHYLDRLQLADKVSILPDGTLSTTDLSQGQRKRLALLTAFLEDRSTYVFDEWAADQDPVYKRVFYREILPDLKARGKGVVVVSHDDGYFSQADRIVRFVDGCLESRPTTGEPTAVPASDCAEPA
ncbi:ABC transporter ATP-binding protein [Lysobacteraceae bacterium NML91-0213]|nr:ABC transporter ATP-binding protein [Xanthomonadaceae bacterium NML91-0213]